MSRGPPRRERSKRPGVWILVGIAVLIVLVVVVQALAGFYANFLWFHSSGVGAVWRAWDHRRRRYVAAKVLQQSDAHTLLRFVREQALRIDNPHVLAPASWAAR